MRTRSRFGMVAGLVVMGLLASSLAAQSAAPTPGEPPSRKPKEQSPPAMGVGGGGGLMGAPAVEPARPPSGGMPGMGGGGFGGGASGFGGRGGPAGAPRGGMGFGGGYAPERPLSDEPRQLKIFALKYAEPQAVAAMIRELELPTGGPRVSVDDRTRQLILNGTVEEFKAVEPLIQALDVAAEERVSTSITRVYKVSNARVKDLAETLRQLLFNRAALAIDERTNALIFCGDPAATSEIEDLLKELDMPVPSRTVAATPMPSAHQIRLVWLISDATAGPMPPDLKDVADELAAIGVSDLHLAAQSLVQTAGDGKFRMACMPSLAGLCRLQIQGQIESDGPAPRLQISVDVQGSVPMQEALTAADPLGDTRPAGDNRPSPPSPRPPSSALERLTSLETVLSAPVGHKVVIGMTPMGKATSVFVVQLLAGERPIKHAEPAVAAPAVSPGSPRRRADSVR